MVKISGPARAGGIGHVRNIHRREFAEGFIAAERQRYGQKRQRNNTQAR